MTLDIKNTSVAVIGLGYVGMPLALMLSKYIKVTGFDVYQKRVDELKKGWDSNREIRQSDLRTSSCIFTSDVSDIANSNIYIVTVPTPIDDDKNPDLNAVCSATEAIAPYLNKGDIVVYESTVYPGVTEDICGPLLEKTSGLACGKDFFLGYSPERINPGDTEHTVENITKVVSAQTPEVTNILADLYGLVNGNNIFKAKNIKIAEASKVIENAQRDINVAFVNEITMILSKMDVSIYDVLEAAGTKWNFLKFVPGLVGGHCIGVDPYYLSQCAQDVGYDPQVILAGRDTNDSMGSFIADRINTFLPTDKKSANILILGFTFKENINDIRNTKVIDVVNTLKAQGHNVDVHDPYAHEEEVMNGYNLTIHSSLPIDKEYDAIALMVAHDIYKGMKSVSLENLLLKDTSLIFDTKRLWKDLEFSEHVSYKTL